MKQAATSRKKLVETARAIAYAEGLSQVSIRRTAADCGVAVGTVYNYFPAKSDLMVAVLEDFWRQLFRKDLWHPHMGQPFPQLMAQVYQNLRQGLSQFERRFLRELDSLPQPVRAKAQETELHYHAHIIRGLTEALAADTDIPPQVWSERFTREDFAGFIFGNFLQLLRSGRQDCALLEEIATRLLYP